MPWVNGWSCFYDSVTFQGVGAFLMASSWEWWLWLWFGLPVPCWCWELRVPAVSVPLPKPWLSPHCPDVPLTMGLWALTPSVHIPPGALCSAEPGHGDG